MAAIAGICELNALIRLRRLQARGVLQGPRAAPLSARALHRAPVVVENRNQHCKIETDSCTKEGYLRAVTTRFSRRVNPEAAMAGPATRSAVLISGDTTLP